MAEYQFFDEGTIPEWATVEWYAEREHAPHVDQVAHRPRLILSACMVADLAFTSGYKVVDLGAGDGGLLSLLPPQIRRWGYDLQPTNVAAAKERGEDIQLRDVLTEPVEWAEVAVCTEMLEHLVDPHGFVRTVAEHSPFIVASSPWCETPDNHYEFHLWGWDFEGYRDLLAQAGYTTLLQQQWSMFQIVAAVQSSALEDDPTSIQQGDQVT